MAWPEIVIMLCQVASGVTAALCGLWCGWLNLEAQPLVSRILWLLLAPAGLITIRMATGGWWSFGGILVGIVVAALVGVAFVMSAIDDSDF